MQEALPDGDASPFSTVCKKTIQGAKASPLLLKTAGQSQLRHQVTNPVRV
jgi:hypothetical protein